MQGTRPRNEAAQANHAIFVAPMLSETQHEFTARETQAIGRILRYGQSKTVHVWRFIVSDTMDETIHKERVRAAMRSE
jgi:hypothetical protein